MLVGNSLGGFTSLLTAVRYPQQVRGVALLNAAGRFSQPTAVVQTALQNDAAAPLAGAVAEVRLNRGS